MKRFLAWLLYVITPRSYPERWQDRLFEGHVSFRLFWLLPVTIYGANAMHWAVHVWFRGAYWCFHPTTRTFGGYWPWKFYISPNATPWAATFALDKSTRRRMAERTREAASVAAVLLALVALPAFAQGAVQAPPAPLSWQVQVANAFWTTVFPGLLTALGALVAWALKKLVDVLHEKASTSKAFAAAEKLAMVVQHEVADAEVTLRPAIAKAMEDGKLTAEEAAELRRQVLERIKASAGPALLGVVQSQVAGNIDAFIGGLVERAVGGLAKAGVSASAVPAPENRPTAPSAPPAAVPSPA